MMGNLQGLQKMDLARAGRTVPFDALGAAEIKALLRIGCDTLDIARAWGVPEAKVYNRLAQASGEAVPPPRWITAKPLVIEQWQETPKKERCSREQLAMELGRTLGSLRNKIRALRQEGKLNHTPRAPRVSAPKETIDPDRDVLRKRDERLRIMARAQLTTTQMLMGDPIPAVLAFDRQCEDAGRAL